ncbi:MAG TPA: hypothetical protein VGO62_14440 [Myxococcota bacterium]|jgi:hypothetical protein
MSHTHDHDPRGFALPVVFLVLLLLAVAFVGLADTVVVGAQASGGRVDRQKKFYACEGVVRLASGIMRDVVVDDPEADDIDLNDKLDPVRTIAAENGIDISAPSQSPQTADVLEEGALAGMEILSSADTFKVSADPSVGCSLNLNQPTGSISVLQFTGFSIEGGDIPSGLTPLKPATDNAFAWGRIKITTPGGSKIDSVDEAGAPLRLPPPGEPEPPFNHAAVVRARTLLSYVQPPFTSNAGKVAERSASRLAYQADIRIVDGEWYVRDPADALAWPGVPLYGDHPCDDDSKPTALCAATYVNDTTLGGFNAAVPNRRRLYSLYERTSGGLLDDVERGVVSYGRIVDNEAAVTTDPTVCPGGAGLRREDQCPVAQRKRVLLEAARTPMSDPGSGTTGILPINIDVGMLGAALATVVNGELGTAVCLPGVLGCKRPFNGIVYVTSTKGVTPATVPGALPAALCGGVDASVDQGVSAGQFTPQPCATAVKYNAVRVFDAADLSAFGLTGLTIGTDLPLYTYGDFNRAGANHRVLLLGARVTALSGSWKDDDSNTSTGGNVTLQTSFVTGFPPAGRKLTDLVRTLEDNVDVRFTGGMVAGFLSPVALAGTHGTRSFAWFQPDDLTHPQNELQPPGVPRVSIGLPVEVADDYSMMGGCGGGGGF